MGKRHAGGGGGLFIDVGPGVGLRRVLAELEQADKKTESISHTQGTASEGRQNIQENRKNR